MRRPNKYLDDPICTVYLHLQKHAVTVLITYYVLLIKALKKIATYFDHLYFVICLSSYMLSSIFLCVMGSVFIYIIKCIIEINTVIKLAYKQCRRQRGQFLEVVALAVGHYFRSLALALAPLVLFTSSHSSGYMYGMLSQYVRNIFVHIFTQGKKIINNDAPIL